METYLLFFIASVIGGVINALAGGGGLITFPLLMLVVGPVTADATSAIALFPAYPAAVWRTRNLLTGVLGSGWLWLLLIPSVLGRLIGALLLSHTGNRNFVKFVPWLVLLATIIIALRPILVRGRESGSVQPDIAPTLWPLAMAAIFVVALYGGYFGGGHRHPDDRRFELHFARRYSARRRAQEFPEWLDAGSGGACARTRG